MTDAAILAIAWALRLVLLASCAGVVVLTARGAS